MTDGPLAILAFDHRAEFSRSVFGRAPERLSPEEFAKLSEAKMLVFEGFLAAKGSAHGVRPGILADEEFASEVLDRSRERDYVLALPVERADQSIFQFDYGDGFLEHITRYRPDFAKALVRISVHDEAESWDLQISRLRRLSDVLVGEGIRFMFELIVRPSTRELLSVGGDRARYEDEVRPEVVQTTMKLVQDAGIAVDVWKLQGVAGCDHARAIAEQARAANRDATCIILGAAADPGRVGDWLQVAAKTDGFAGFALGRNIWRTVLRDWLGGIISEEAVVDQVGAAYLDYIDRYLSAGR